ncbi:hypothetical protein SpCBS45565_g02485 [Spizellomyces sp. 'palustris']|nr:hypothetical protein SpCBS45565_g02485 [Spizellomyces sp. 'palustris']
MKPAHTPSRTESNASQTSLERELKRISRLYIQRRFDEAYGLCQKQFGSFGSDGEQAKLWNILAVLYLRIAAQREDSSQSEEARPTDWDYMLRLYGGAVEKLPADVLCAGILLLQKRRLHSSSKQAIETWLATLPDDYFWSLSNEVQSDALQNYERIVELYCLHVLPSLGEWESAKDFLEWNEVIATGKRALYRKKLDEMERRRRSVSSREASPGAENQAKSENAPSFVPAMQKESTTPVSGKQGSDEAPKRQKDQRLETQSSGQQSTGQSAQSETGGKPQDAATQSASQNSASASPPQSTDSITRTRATIRHWLAITRGVPAALLAILLLLAISRFLRRFKNTVIGRAVSLLADKIYTTAKMGLNMQTI